jgi:hypothetical protein
MEVVGWSTPRLLPNVGPIDQAHPMLSERLAGKVTDQLEVLPSEPSVWT